MTFSYSDIHYSVGLFLTAVLLNSCIWSVQKCLTNSGSGYKVYIIAFAQMCYSFPSTSFPQDLCKVACPYKHIKQCV